jgi:hypothetical protein
MSHQINLNGHAFYRRPCNATVTFLNERMQYATLEKACDGMVTLKLGNQARASKGWR